MGNYTATYTTDDLPDIVGDVIGTAGVETKTYVPLYVMGGAIILLVGAVATIIHTWRKG